MSEGNDGEETPGRFIAVLHEWFIGSYGFTTVELGELPDEQAAQEKAAQLQVQHASTFNHAAVTVLKVGPEERLVRMARRSVWDRILAVFYGD